MSKRFTFGVWYVDGVWWLCWWADCLHVGEFQSTRNVVNCVDTFKYRTVNGRYPRDIACVNLKITYHISCVSVVWIIENSNARKLNHVIEHKYLLADQQTRAFVRNWNRNTQNGTPTNTRPLETKEQHPIKRTFVVHYQIPFDLDGFNRPEYACKCKKILGAGKPTREIHDVRRAVANSVEGSAIW